MTVREVTKDPGRREPRGRILVVTAGRSGLLYSSVELARRLVAAGHRITYAAPVAAREIVEHHQLDFIGLEASRYEDFLEQDRNAGRLQRLLHLRRRRVEAVESLALDSFVEAVADLDPDLMLIDGEMHEHIIAASGSGVPTALLNTFVSIWRRPGLPPPHHQVQPGVGWKGSRLGIRILWFALRVRKWRKALVQLVQRVGCDRRSILRHLARETDFALSRETDSDQWLIPFTYRRLPVLSLHGLEFEFPHQPRDGVHYVGPLVLLDRADRSMMPGEGSRLDALLRHHRKSVGETKLIYAGFGSEFSTDLDLVRRLVNAVAERPDFELLISLGGRALPAELGGLPKRHHVFSWVPQMRVLEVADVMVMHGGINTLDECVLSNVPALIYCGGETDMAGSTVRAVYHGIGIAGDRSRDRTAEILGSLERLLTEPGFRQNIEQLRRQYLDAVDRRLAERVVESLLQDRAKVGGPRPDGTET